jgi:hypothetical protein
MRLHRRALFRQRLRVLDPWVADRELLRRSSDGIFVPKWQTPSFGVDHNDTIAIYTSPSLAQPSPLPL